MANASNNRHMSAEAPVRPLEPKVYAAFKSFLPFEEKPRASLTSYKNNQGIIHNRFIKRQSRSVDAPEKKFPFFHMINSHQVPARLRYGDVVQTLITCFVLIYNKFSEVVNVPKENFKNSLKHIASMDRQIVKKVLKEICVDMNIVSRPQSTLYITQAYASLDIPRLPNLRGGDALNQS
mgnify:CR=1 FL=1